MAVLKKHQRQTYTIIDNTALRDDTLSWRATGLLAYLLGLPDDWSINTTDLSRRKTDGRTSTASAMTELEDAGYIIRKKERDNAGRYRTVVHCAESPEMLADLADQPTLGFPQRSTRDGQPDADTPTAGKPTDGNPATTKEPEEAPIEELPIEETIGADEILVPEVIHEETAAAPRPRNPAWDELVAIFYEPDVREQSLFGKLAALANQAAAAEGGSGDPAWEIRIRAERLIGQWSVRALTPPSLMNHWLRFGSRIGAVTAEDEEKLLDEWRRAQRRQAMEALADAPDQLEARR